jgi:hypothetical protein
MESLRRLVLDVLKPMEPNIVDLAQLLASLPGVEGVNVSIYEIDHRVENAKVTIEGSNISYERVIETIEDNGGAIHSIDEVAAGKILIDDVDTPQD